MSTIDQEDGFGIKPVADALEDMMFQRTPEQMRAQIAETLRSMEKYLDYTDAGQDDEEGGGAELLSNIGMAKYYLSKLFPSTPPTSGDV